jgi:release factor glutamine methyltransferase
MTIQEARQYCTEILEKVYEKGEAIAISKWLLEHLTRNTDDNSNTTTPLLTDEQFNLLKQQLYRLEKQEPLQYVLNEAWFFGLPFYVDENVLIPRPETEELVEWILATTDTTNRSIAILDIGCGSGCIPISLKKKLTDAEVLAVDISKGAIDVAKKNAAAHTAAIHFTEMDFLNTANWEQLPVVDIIVSNPPYIPLKDMATMRPNVLAYEPHTALFVADNDPLLFYAAIARFGKTHLQKNGSLFFETHEDLAQHTASLLEKEGYTTSIKKDMQGKERMIRAWSE